MKKEKILIIIPAYNEEKNILNTYNSIIEYNNKHSEKYDVIVINDGSKDNTEKILNDNNIPHIKLIQNLGIGGAVQTGYKYAYYNNYDIAVQFDGDGQHDINYVSKIIEPLKKKNFDMCIGSRFLEKDDNNFKSTRARRIGIKIISFFIKLVTKQKISDPTSGFRAVNKKIICLFANKYPIEYPEPISEVTLLKSGYQISEVQVKMHERIAGKSSINSWKNAYYMINVVLSIILLKRDGKNEK